MTDSKFDLAGISRIALEHAKFASPDIRDSLAAFLKAVQLDLEDVAFEPSVHCRNTMEALEACIDEVEAPARRIHDKNLRVLVDEPEKEDEVVDDTEVNTKNVRVVEVTDEELDEFGNPE